MGAELGATTTVFPSDEEVRDFLRTHNRGDQWVELKADKNAEYDEYEEIDLSKLEPLIALPSSPDNVVPVREVVGRPIYQSMIGSSANPGFRDFAIAGHIVNGKKVAANVSLDINPTSRSILENLTTHKVLEQLIHAGGRIHQAGCNGCIGMGQAPATGKNSLRTVPRNFPGRSGTKEDAVYLCSPETAAASALAGVITDPRTLKIAYTKIKEPSSRAHNEDVLAPPKDKKVVKLEKGPNIQPIPPIAKVIDKIEGPVLIKVENNISTDTIMPAGEKVLPFRSNIPELSKFTFSQLDEDYYNRAWEYRKTGHFIIASLNYGQGSSREHAALGPRYLGVQAVVAKSYARIHWQNLVNFGILPLTFKNRNDYSKIKQGDVLVLNDVIFNLKNNNEFVLYNKTRKQSYPVEHILSSRQVDILLEGGMINYFRKHNKKVGRKGEGK
jgi:aconitate hydratase